MTGPQESYVVLTGLISCIVASRECLSSVQETMRRAEELERETREHQRRWRTFLRATASPYSPAADPAVEDRLLLTLLGLLPQRDPPRASVLIIDDDEGLREVLRFALEDEGYTVLTASDGVIGLALLRTRTQPLIVLLDWWMPGLDGIQLLQALYADASAATLRHTYLLMTAATASRDPHPHLPGVPDHMDVTVLAKPMDLERLLLLIAERAARIATPAQ